MAQVTGMVVTAPVPLKYKTFWRRFGAGLIDALVFAPLWFVDDWIWESRLPVAIGLCWFVTLLVAHLAYGIVLHGLFGQTLGKRLCGVRVVDISEKPLSMFRAVLRDSPWVALAIWGAFPAIGRILSGEPPYSMTPTPTEQLSDFFSTAWMALELLTMLSNPKRRSIHDLLARSVVIRDRV